MNEEVQIHCSFCAKHNMKVQYIITGPGVHICNECIIIANNVLLEKMRGK